MHPTQVLGIHVPCQIDTRSSNNEGGFDLNYVIVLNTCIFSHQCCSAYGNCVLYDYVCKESHHQFTYTGNNKR